MRSPVASAAALLILSGCALKGDVRRVQEQLQQFRAETARADSARAVEFSRSLSEIIDVVEALRDSLAAQQRHLVVLRGETRSDFTEVQRQLVQLGELAGQSQQRLTELRSQLERRSQAAPVPAAVGAVGAVPGDSAGPVVPAGLPPPEQLYDLSLSQLRRGSPQAARMGFRQFLEVYGTHERAGDAQFFIGESWAGTDRDSAAAAYEEVVQRHPNSPRAPSALYKLGLLAEQAGDVSAARVYYNRVIAGYPRSEEAALARDKLNPGG